jgi:hypothetical protein
LIVPMGGGRSLISPTTAVDVKRREVADPTSSAASSRLALLGRSFAVATTLGVTTDS